MTKLKNTTILLLLALCMAFAFAGCAVEGDTNDTMYDVAIRLKCNDTEIYEFPVGTNERHITVTYDGRDRSYWVDSYNIPEQGDTWSYECEDAFEMSMTYCPPDGQSSAYFGPVKDVGEYCITCETVSALDTWKPRRIQLYITIPDPVGDIYYGVNELSINGNEEREFRVHAEKYGYYKLSVDNATVTIIEGAEALSDGTYLIYLSENNVPQVTLSNSSREEVSCRVTIDSDFDELSLGETVNCSAGTTVAKFINHSDQAVRYNLTVPDAAGIHYNVNIYNEDGAEESTLFILSEPTYTFVLDANQVCYVVCHFLDDCSIVINEDDSSYGWVIMTEGQTAKEAFTIENVVKLERGVEYTIYMAEIDENGNIVEVDTHYGIIALSDNYNAVFYGPFVLEPSEISAESIIIVTDWLFSLRIAFI